MGEGYRFNADDTLEAAKGMPFDRMMILGELQDGTIYIEGNCNAGEVMILMELAKREIIE